MARTFAFLVVLLVSISTYSQTMVIHNSDGTSTRILVADINKITFDFGTANVQKPEVINKVKTVFAKILPNPFATKIEYNVQTSSLVHISVINMQGQIVNVLQNSKMEPGHYFSSWNQCNGTGKKVTNGAYIINVSIDGKLFSKTLFIVK
jgi:hypothetical protein